MMLTWHDIGHALAAFIGAGLGGLLGGALSLLWTRRS